MTTKDIVEITELIDLLRKLPESERTKVFFMVKGILIAIEQAV